MIFVDTNILVYAEDRDAGSKHEIARERLVELWETEEGALSVQVLQEFFVTVTRKVPSPLPVRTARRIVEEYLTWTLVENTGGLLLAGIDLAQSARLSLWDAMIVEAARAAGCECVLTEDLSHGQRFGSVRIVNLFV